ncbi:uncharacterized protein [Drosophila tropicalis]|uniref:uncharacterized protein n=1 Tax=Drosophila tropicalis TaxID=46794 RepID=UPI0035ABBA89
MSTSPSKDEKAAENTSAPSKSSIAAPGQRQRSTSPTTPPSRVFQTLSSPLTLKSAPSSTTFQQATSEPRRASQKEVKSLVPLPQILVTAPRVTRSETKRVLAASTMALKKFVSICDKLSQFEVDTHVTSLSEVSVFTLQVRRDRVQALWEKVEQEYEKCEALSDGKDDSSEDLAIQAKYDKCYQVYERCTARLNELIHEGSAPTPPNRHAPTSAPAERGCRLPPIDTEVFSGDYLKWPTFRDLFTAIYKGDSRISPVEKLYHLLAKTRGEANLIVAKFPLTNDGFETAWNALKQRFENKRLIVNSQFRALLDLPQISHESGKALQDHQNALQASIRAFEHCGLPVTTWGGMFVFFCSIKLPKNTLSLWEQSLGDKTAIPEWQMMDDFLTERFRTLEAVENTTAMAISVPTSKPPRNPIPATRKANTFEAKVTTKPKSCDLCMKENHPVRRCPRFLQMTVPERVAYIKKKSLCLNCFARGHQVKDCPSQHNCFTCKGRHNTLQTEVCGSLMAQETRFGWVISGPLQGVPVSSCAAFTTRVAVSREEGLETLLTRFWEVEDLPGKPVGDSDSVCEVNFQKTTRRDVSGRYTVSLPFRDPTNINLGHSRPGALAQFLKNESRLLKNIPTKTEYDAVIQEYLDLGHMRQVPFDGTNNNFYLPHHAVFKPDSTTTKVRVVFNASSKSTNGVSLNDILYPGPVLQSDLTTQILNWRFFRVVFNADITKMYRQIMVDPIHTPFQRILFRNKEGQLGDYELNTVTFGINCAPFLAIRVLQQLASDVQSKFPLASDIIKSYMYVDDVLAGAHNETTAIAMVNELQDALGSAGFPLRKWTSNVKSREVLGQIAKLFDPAGWLAPFVIQAKVFMQELWLQELGWDDQLPSELHHRWQDFTKSYSFLDQIRIPRWVLHDPNSDIQFHCFCDASQRAYGAAIYVRVSNDQGISCCLLAAKSRVAPVKTVSLPRLELCGATLLAELAAAVLPQLPVDNAEAFYWSDSTVVLSWLNKPPRTWTTFVANRVAKIVTATNDAPWNHVSSEDNPADLPSRGLSAQELVHKDLWWHGPPWLREPQESWQRATPLPLDTALEKRVVKVHVAIAKPANEILSRFSNLARALRVIAYVIRFGRRCRKLPNDYSGEVTSSEINQVLQALIRVTQRDYFPTEHRCLQQKKSLPTSSTILNLNPFIDVSGVIRACGRVQQAAALSYDERNPILLPVVSPLSRLLVLFTHQISLHGGSQLVVRLIRQRYWIPRLRNLVKSVVNSCKVCVIYKRRLQSQLMGTLPAQRTTFARPFTTTGIDFAGPFDIKSFTGRACRISKGYVCVFVCFSTKAIHLEATSDLSTEAFLAAFARFVSRRGCPQQVQSDNGKNFVGASRVLEKDFLSSTQQKILSHYSHQNLSWHFIPPGAPHMGGLWEAGVKSFKTLFYKATCNQRYTFEEFSTLLAKVEACLNSRPISPMSEDPTDSLALTPGHFLVGGPLLSVTEPEFKDQVPSIINRWQRLKAVSQHFCTRWKDEYLKELHKRNKWRFPSKNLEVGDLVVFKDDNLPFNEWRLGRIHQTHPGSDGNVRVVELLTARGIVKRPVAKSAPEEYQPYYSSFPSISDPL